MGKAGPHDPIKIVVGLISSDRALFDKTSLALAKKLGPMDLESDVFPFNHTDYYREEFGTGLERKFISFRNLIKAEAAPEIKTFTNTLEKRLSRGGRRTVNIDPGYLTSGKLVLLTTKNYSHRIYLKKGIYAEVTLYFKNGSFRPWQWSYPDYKTDCYRDFFNHVRGIYMGQIKEND